MAQFKVSGYFTPSADGKTLTLNDTSNYSNNDQGYTVGSMVSRNVQFLDSDGNVIASSAFTGTNLTLDLPVTKDIYVEADMNFATANGSLPTTIVDYVSTALYSIAQRNMALKLNCACASKGKLCDNMVKARECANAATSFNLVGDAGDAQKMIDAANAFLSEATKCNCGC